MIDRLEFATEAKAFAMADKLHANMIATDREYAKSVSQGHTTAWAIPYEDGKVWCVNVKDRGRVAVETADRARLKPFAVRIVPADPIIEGRQ